MAYETELRILGGLPVTIEFTVNAAEPDVGYWGGVDDWYVVAVNGKYGKNAKSFDWVHKRIDATKGEADRIVEQLNEVEIDDYDDRY